VFKLNNAGRETVLHSFRGYPTDGALPEGGLVRDAAGNLYGTTPSGGTSDYGAAFELNKTGKETVLHSFADMDGANPEAGLIRDGGGDLYGTTASGGAYQYGTVFELTSNGAETVLYSFAGGSDGEQPMAGLARDKAGNLYGTTLGGGAYGYGTVFKLTPSKSRNWKESVLYSFTGETDGAYPYAGVIEDAQGNLYGTAADGGSGGNGTVWKLTP
jgi:uncharacterized repeat protein (TIGR03803 family)